MLTHFLPQCPYVVLSVGNTCRIPRLIDMVNYILERKTVNRMSIMFMKSALPFFQNSKLPYNLHLASLVENWPNTNKHNNRKHSGVFRKRVLIHLMIMTIWKHRDPIPFLLVHCTHFPTFCMLSKI